MKANHNSAIIAAAVSLAVSNGSKILKWKQITTEEKGYDHAEGCFQWFKDTKMKANHNSPVGMTFLSIAVSNGSKILKWKQITTGKNTSAKRW